MEKARAPNWRMKRNSRQRGQVGVAQVDNGEAGAQPSRRTQVKEKGGNFGRKQQILRNPDERRKPNVWKLKESVEERRETQEQEEKDEKNVGEAEAPKQAHHGDKEIRRGPASPSLLGISSRVFLPCSSLSYEPLAFTSYGRLALSLVPTKTYALALQIPHHRPFVQSPPLSLSLYSLRMYLATCCGQGTEMEPNCHQSHPPPRLADCPRFWVCANTL